MSGLPFSAIPTLMKKAIATYSAHFPFENPADLYERY